MKNLVSGWTSLGYRRSDVRFVKFRRELVDVLDVDCHRGGRRQRRAVNWSVPRQDLKESINYKVLCYKKLTVNKHKIKFKFLVKRELLR